MGWHFSFTPVVPVPLYAVEKLARLFFFSRSPLSGFLCPALFLPVRNGQKQAEGLLVFIERWAKAGVVDAREKEVIGSERANRSRGCVYIELFRFRAIHRSLCERVL